MKYIRTKDGRISYLSSEPNEEFCDYEIITNKGTITYRREDEVVKVADIIEELCDEFVVCDGIYTATFKNYKLAKSTKGELYGAIWTDKGLIFVARMNNEGVLELL